ncbi:MAG: YqeG family HAD IIIA-type phosphatase [Clostridiales bacterium]|nr:YqeG family HAD IIIA-type phosphatase [Clostridiales bacterium]
MFDKFLPDQIFDNIYSLTPEFLIKNGIRALILDIDNTLVTYDDPKPTETVKVWLDRMHENGIQTAFVSNNHSDRVNEFCEGLGCYYHADAGKPSRKFMREAMEYMKTDIGTTAGVGDQLFTDVWAAKRCGMRSYFVPPIKDKKTLFFRFKRMLEKPFIKSYYKKNNSSRA